MPEHTYTIHGLVVSGPNRIGVANLRIEAWDKDLICNDLVGSAVTDAHGAFRIHFDQSHFAELFLDRRPDLFFKVFKGDTLIHSTEDSVLWNVDAGDTKIEIEVNVAVEEPGIVKAGHSLRVSVGSLEGRKDVEVRARLHPVVGDPVDLDPVWVGSDGNCDIFVPEDVLDRIGMGGLVRSGSSGEGVEPGDGARTASPVSVVGDAAALISASLEVYADGEVIGATGPLYRLKPSGRIEVKIRPLPVYDLIRTRIESRLGPLEQVLPKLRTTLDQAGRPKVDLESIRDFAGNLNLPPGTTCEFIHSYLDMSPDTRRKDHAESFATKASLPEGTPHPSDDAARIEAAIKANLVSGRLQAKVDEARARRNAELKEQKEREAREANERRIQSLASDRGTGKPAFADLLDGAGLIGDGGSTQRFEPLRRALARAGLRPRDGKPDNRLQQLTEELSDAGVSADSLKQALERVDLAEHLATTLDVGAPVLREIMAVARDRATHAPDTFGATLAGLGTAGWVSLVSRAQDGKSDKVVEDARRLARTLERTHPMDALRGPLKAAARAGSGAAIQKKAATLHKLLETLPAEADPARLSSSWEDEAGLRQAIRNVLESLGDAPDKAVSRHVKEVQRLERLARIAPGPAAVTLWAAGCSGAAEIARETSAAFAENYRNLNAGGDESPEMAAALIADAREIHRRALGSLAVETAIFSAMKLRGENGIALHGQNPLTAAPGGESPVTPANYATFFGSPDACKVPDGLSALGCAAYLVDLLDFLKNAAPGERLLKEFDRRRPDVRNIKLTESNASTALPLVDIINERLEAELHAPAGDPQTTNSEAELAIAPERIDSVASNYLRDARWPFAVPFNAGSTKLDLWLKELGIARVELTMAVHGDTAGLHVRTANSLGLSAEEAKLIRDGMPAQPFVALSTLHGGEVLKVSTGANTGVWLVRTETAGSLPDGCVRWDESADKASDILDLFDVEAADLNDLLETGSVRTATGQAPALIRDTVDHCDLTKAKVTGLTPSVRERIVLFLRLRRRLGWTTEELDGALFASGAWHDPGGAFTSGVRDALDELAAIRRLMRNGTTLEDLSGDKRWSRLAVITGVTVDDIKALASLLGMDQIAKPSAMEHLLERLTLLRDAGFSREEVAFLLKRNAPPPADMEKGIKSLCEELAGAEIQIPANANEATKKAVALSIARRVAKALGIRPAAAAALLRVDQPLTPASPEIRRLQQGALLINRLGLAAQDIYQHRFLLGVIDLGELSTAGADANDTARENLVKACPWPGVRDRMRKRGVSAAGLTRGNVTEPEAEAAWSGFAVRFGVPAAEWEAIRGAIVLPTPAPTTIHPGDWSRILDVLDASQRAGVSVATILTWAAVSTDDVAAESASEAVRARRGEAAWNERARNIGARLRDARRRALLAAAGAKYTAATGDEAAVDVLFPRLLMDPLVSVTRRTTRIECATDAIQRFVQRVQLAMEADDAGPLQLNPEALGRWVSMRTYAVWLTNRRAFLFPECCLRPEIRHDQSSLFKDTRQLLLQRESSPENLEEVVAKYVSGLDEIARLEMMGACLEDPETGESTTAGTDNQWRLHVLARTHGSPHRYFLRALDGRTRRWTPWEPIDLDIDGDWAIPMIREGRMELYWVRHARNIEGMKDVMGMTSASPFPLEPHLPMIQDQYTLSWAVCRRGKWGNKRSVERPIARPVFPFGDAQFAVRELGGRLRVAGVTPFPPPFLPVGTPPGIPGAPDNDDRCRPMVYALGPKLFPTKEELDEAARQAAEAGRQLINSATTIITGWTHPPEPTDGDYTSLVVDPLPPGPLGQLVSMLDTLLRQLNSTDPPPSFPSVKALLDIRNEVVNRIASYLSYIHQAAGEIHSRIVDGVMPVLERLNNLADLLSNTVAALKDLKIGDAAKGALGVAGAFLLGTVEWIAAAIHRVVEEGGDNETIKDLVTMLRAFGGLPGWVGPTPALEFGFFDLGPSNARAVRLTLPSPRPITALGAVGVGAGAAVGVGALGFGAAGAATMVAGSGAFAPLGAVAMMMAPPALAIGTTTAAAGLATAVAAEVGYTLFPGYPGLFDLPLQTGLMSLQLPTVGFDGDMGLFVWPGSGLIVPPIPALQPMTISLNIGSAILEEISVWPESGTGAGSSDPMGQVKDGTSKLVQSLGKLEEQRENAFSSMRQGIRWTRPTPFEPFPGRQAAPNPSLITDERRGRTFALIPDSGLMKVPLVQPHGFNAQPRVTTWTTEALYHPLSLAMCATIEHHGAKALYESASDGGSRWNPHAEPFTNSFAGGDSIKRSKNPEGLDLRSGSAYGSYNWELLYHLPMMIGDRLRAARRHEEALVWYARVFDPAAASGASAAGAWRFQALREAWTQDWNPDSADADSIAERAGALLAWQERPFDPHAVAAWRPDVYARSAFLGYVETLIEWAEYRLALDVAENVGLATQLYLRARDLMGPPPRWSPSEEQNPKTAGEAADGALEPALGGAPDWVTGGGATVPDEVYSIVGPSLWSFAIPVHPAVEAIWRRIESGLRKVRSWSGGALAGSGATVQNAGWSDSPGDDANDYAGFLVPSPYRFQFLVQKALEYCAAAKAMAGELQSALNSLDGERLARMRQIHEITLLNAGRTIREHQIEEASRSVEAAGRAVEGAKIRQKYYSTRLFISPTEFAKEALSFVSSGLQVAAGVNEFMAAPLQMLPNVDFRTVEKATGSLGIDLSGKLGFDVQAGVQWGTSQMANALSATARGFSVLSSIARIGADVAGAFATYERRQEEWDHQIDLAKNDLVQAEAQLDAAKLRLEIVKLERDNHLLQLDHAVEVDRFLHEKYTNQELFEWLSEQLQTLCFDTWRRALEMARNAEVSWRFERLLNKPWIRTGQWFDGFHGALAANFLEDDLRRMEKSYLDDNFRDPPLERRVCLSKHDPIALLRLRQTGQCIVDLPERLFDLDKPGDYNRRIREVRLSIPCVVGPNTPINARLELSRTRVRVTDRLTKLDGTTAVPYPVQSTDDRFWSWPPEQNQSDGLPVVKVPVAELSVMTALEQSGATDWYPRDDRYVPFEGAGAISTWLLQLPRETNRFDFATITEVILDLRFTARRGEERFRAAAWSETFPSDPAPSDLMPPDQIPVADSPRLINLRTEFPDAWHSFQHPTGNTRTLPIVLTSGHFGYTRPEHAVSIPAIEVIVVAGDEALGAKVGLLVAGEQLVSQPLAEFPDPNLPETNPPGESIPGVMTAKWPLSEAATASRDAPLAVVFTTNVDTSSLGGAGLDPGLVSDILLSMSWIMAPATP